MPDERNVKKWGFGAAPISSRMRERYDAAVRTGFGLLDDQLVATPEVLGTISELKGMFNRCAKKDQWDWCTVHAELGRPSHQTCREIVGLLTCCRSALRDLDAEAASRYQLRLQNSELFHCLKNYRDRNCDKPEEVGYLHVLSTRDQPDVLKIGMTTRTPEQRIKELNSATALLFPYSARKVVEVRNAAEIERLIHEELSPFCIRSDREFFRLPYVEAAEIRDSIVAKHGQLVRHAGTVKRFLADKGFGFISTPGGDSIFFHVSSLAPQHVDVIRCGVDVTFRLINTAKGVEAREITVS